MQMLSAEMPSSADAVLVEIGEFFTGLVDPEAVADLTRRLTVPPGCAEPAGSTLRVLNAFLDRIQSSLYELCRVSNDVSRGAAENTYLLARIASATGDQSAETTQVAAAVHETAQAAQIVTQSSEATRDLTAEMRRTSLASFQTMEESLRRLEELRTTAADAVRDVEVVVESSNQIELVLDVIDDISGRSQMLGINAAIEAAHAGEGGRGFAIVASEIKRLAESTRASTREITQLVHNVRASVESARLATQRSAQATANVAVGAGRVRDDLTTMSRIVDGTTEQMSAIASAVDEQSTTLHAVSENIERLSAHARDVADHAGKAGMLELTNVSTDVFAITGRYALGTFFDQVLAWGNAFAEEVERSLEEAVDARRVRPADLFDTVYVPIAGADVRSLARLFNVSRVGRDGFDPPKFSTRYDRYIDEPLMDICDRHAGHDPKIVFASVTDLNGFFIMGPKSLRRDITGNRDADLAGNRIKRIFDDATGLRAARVGLPGADALPTRASRETFEQAGFALGRPRGARAFLRQTYARDTGRIYNDIALPVYVQGERFGSVRIAYDPSVV